MENDKHRLGGEESGTLVHTGEEVKNGVNSVENSLTVPPKDQHRITRWLSNSTPKCIRKRAENRKFWSMTETQEAPQLTSTPAHTKLTATTQSHWKKSSNELSQCYRLGKQENTHIGEGLGTPSSHEEQRRRLGQLQGFETQPRAWEGGTTRFLSYTWSHGQDWKTLLFDLMPRSQYRWWRKMKSPHWVLNIWKSLPHTCR